MALEFFMPMQRVPTVTHQQKQVRVTGGKPRFYEPADLKAARAQLMAALHPHRPPAPLKGPLQLAAKWCFAPTAGRKIPCWRTTRPDTDNLQKLLKDCMTAAGFWQDDAQVASEICEKFYSLPSGIWIRVGELAELGTEDWRKT